MYGDYFSTCYKMKALINKNNPAIRITAPEIIETSLYYVLDFANDDNTSETDLFKDNWTLVEEEPEVELEEIAGKWVTETASGTADEMEFLIDIFKKGLEVGYNLGKGGGK